MSFLKTILRFFRSIAISLVLVCMVVFMIDNRDIIMINTQPLPFEIQTRVFILMLFCFVLGFICGIVSCSPAIIQNFFRKVSDRKKIKKLEKQLNQ